MKLRKKLFGIPGKSREISERELTKALIEMHEHNERRKKWQPKMEIKGYQSPWED